MKRPRCTGKTVKGKRCKAYPLHGTERCAAHPLSTGLDPVFGSPEQAAEAGKLGGRPRLPRVAEAMRVKVEEQVDKILAPYFECLDGAIVVAKYEGEVHESDLPDYGARIAAAERLLDRVYGKPRQALELQGASETAPPISIVAGDDSPETAAAAHAFLARIHAGEQQHRS